MEDLIEIWAQDSKVKGLRVIRFKVDKRPEYLRWIGPLDGPDDQNQFRYGRNELIENKWERLE
jgi:hypothetical protein